MPKTADTSPKKNKSKPSAEAAGGAAAGGAAAGGAAGEGAAGGSSPATPATSKGFAAIKAGLAKEIFKKEYKDRIKRAVKLLREMSRLPKYAALEMHYLRAANHLSRNERRDGDEKPSKSMWDWARFKGIRQGSKLHATLAERFDGVPQTHFPFEYETKSLSQVRKACWNDWHAQSEAMKEQMWKAKMDDIEKKHGSWAAYQKERIAYNKKRTEEQFNKFSAWEMAQEEEREERARKSGAGAGAADLIDLTRDDGAMVDLTVE